MTSNVTYTEVERSGWECPSVAPNGSHRGADYWTKVVRRQVWHDIPDNGIYAGLIYRVTDVYVSTIPGQLGQCTGSSSQPWSW